ncbi:lipopolysaccharide transport periplasmic protein LptA [Halomonas sp. M4R1S46]|uniref:lipopolysaccharide transport periplasmic protein LptA n=1 Tax=Halomonas sp. M4R1S46 TaxID=2982692 RepID=UPI0021E35E76|nr:lipopolysaccharide transport periplasmic protein LptA [Halomonas sp. M4R1S46]UYG08842.1 lipopolysaccharide transport periplasmic protein LptA [Halomonas sp. M4R1S46]
MMRPPPATLLALSLAALSLAAGPALALEGDASAPIQVEADRLDLDDRAGTAVYRGDVTITQGSMQLTGERVEIQRNAAGRLTRATATGERAYLEQKPAPDEPLVRGWGRTVVYHVAERRIELIDQAELHQGGDTFDGGYLEYFLDRRVVQARSAAEGVDERQRVRMTLEPEQQDAP